MSRVAVLVLLFAAAPCLGWGTDGHKIASAIAADNLTLEAKAAVAELLGNQALVDVCTWADEIRSDPAFRWASSLHYANVLPGADGFDLQRDCPVDGCVVSAIIKCTAVLQGSDASAADRATALKFLVHFVEDVHQTLHVSHAKDKGGNDIKVEFFYNRTNLHGVWDSELIRRTKMPWSAYAEELRRGITPEQFADWQRATDPAQWATEAYRFALSHAYGVPRDGQLEQDYFARCIPVVNQRLAMAGVRLATMLNRIFAESGGAIQATETQPTGTPATTAGAVAGGRSSDAHHDTERPVVRSTRPESPDEHPDAPPSK